MTTEDLIEEVIELSVEAYKKTSKGCEKWRKLNRHETVIINGISFNYWREYGIYKVCEWLHEQGVQIECTLDGNDSSIIIDNLDDDKQREINGKLFVLYKKYRGGL